MQTTDAVSKLKHVTTQTKLRSFFCLCNVFRCFVPNFNGFEVPVKKKLSSDHPKQFCTLDEKESASFALLKDLISPLVLDLRRAEWKFTLDSDPCDKQIGCLIFQEKEDGSNHPLATGPKHSMKPNRN